MNPALFLTGFGAATAFLPGSLAPGLAGRWAVLAVLLPVALLMTPRTDRTGWFAAWTVAFVVGIAAASLSWTTDFLGGFDELVHLSIIALAFWLGANTLNAKSLWRGSCWGVAVSAALVFMQLAGYDGVQQSVAPAGLFMNKNVAGEAGLVALVAALANGWWVFAAIFAAMVFATGSKAVLGALVLVVAFWLLPRAPRVAKWMFVGLAAMIVLAFAGYAPSAGVRLDIWADAFAGLSFFGNGIGSFGAAFPAALFAHSEPLHVLYELGAPWTFAVVALAVFSVWRRDAGTELEQAIVIGIGAVSLLSFPLHMPFTAFAAAFATGYVLGARGLLRDGEPSGGVHRAVIA